MINNIKTYIADIIRVVFSVFFILSFGFAIGQKPNQSLNVYRIDSLYGNFQSVGDTTIYKPVVMNSNGKQKKMTYWPTGSGGGSVTSVSGTANRITSTGGSTPVIDIAATYVGQSSITTLGTVTTGTLGTGAIVGGVTMTLGSDATGDIYYRNAGGILTRLPIGTAAQTLHVVGGIPAWVDTSAGGGGGNVTKVGTPANDQLAVWTGDGTLGAESTATFNPTDGLYISGYRTDGPKFRVGDFILQPSSLNNSFIMDNMKYGASGWEYINAGKASGFQLYDGQTMFVNANTGSGGAIGTIYYTLKTGYDQSVGIGGNISTTAGDYTGAGLIVSATNTRAVGNILMGGTTVATSATKTFHLFNGTVPSASITDGVLLYSEDVAASAELKVRDEAGNVTTLSPHNFSGILNGRSEDLAWAYYSEKDGKYINVDMLKLARAIEKLTGEKLVYIGNTKDELPNKENK